MEGSVTVTYGAVIGLPGYSSGKLDVTINVPIESKETPEKAADRAYKIAEKVFKGKVESTMDEIESHLRKKN